MLLAHGVLMCVPQNAPAEILLTELGQYVCIPRISLFVDLGLSRATQPYAAALHVCLMHAPKPQRCLRLLACARMAAGASSQQCHRQYSHMCVRAGAGACVSSVCAHRGPIHAVVALPRTHGAALLSAGKDHVIRLMRAPGLDAAAAAHSSDPGHQVCALLTA